MMFDLGATSGRTVLGMLSNGELRIRELTRFPNQTLPLDSHFYWNIFSLYEHLCDGLRAAVRDFALTKGLPVALLAGVCTPGNPRDTNVAKILELYRKAF